MIEKISGVYEIKNKTNDKRYIGSSKNIHSRWKLHKTLLRNGKHHSKHLQKSWDKYGENVFEFNIIEIVIISLEEYFDKNLENREIYFISLYDTTNGNYGYNETSGGRGCPNRVMSDETKIKITSKTRGKKRTEEQKKRISECQIGKHHSEETKRKMSKTRMGKPQPWNLGRIVSKSTRKKLSKINRERIHSKEEGDKISSEKTGKKTKIKSISKYVGVSYNRNRHKWIAYISINKKRIHLGYFLTENDAALAYNKKAIKEFGTNARLNILENKEIK